MFDDEALEDRKKLLANEVVDLIVNYEINKFMRRNDGWICGFGMDKRIEKSKRKFISFSLEELEFLNDLYSNEDKSGILDKYPFTREEALEIFKKAKSNMPLIFFHRYIT